MHRVGRLLLVMGLTLSATPTVAGEIIRYRLPSGELGFADQRSAVPDGAEILEIEPTPQAGPPGEPASPDLATRQPARVRNAGAASTFEAERQREAAEAERWALERMRLEDSIREAQKAISESERHVRRQCWRKSGSRGRYAKDGPQSCGEAADQLAEAKSALDTAREERAGLEERCRLEGCLPGWIRD